jgi:hypothetical protein
MLRWNILHTILLTFTCLAHDEYGTTPPAQEYNPYRTLMAQYMMLSKGSPSFTGTSSSSYIPTYPSAPIMEEEAVDESSTQSVSSNPYPQLENSSRWSSWQVSDPEPPLTTAPLSPEKLTLEEIEKKPVEEKKPTNASQELALISTQITEDKRDPNIYEQLKKLQEQNKILLELVKCNTEQLQVISEVLGVKFEQSEKNQEEILSYTVSLQQKMTYLKKYVENHQSSTWYTLYQCGQTGLQLSKAAGAAAGTFKILSILPAFVLPGWAVYVGTLAAGSAVYFLKL